DGDGLRTLSGLLGEFGDLFGGESHRVLRDNRLRRAQRKSPRGDAAPHGLCCAGFANGDQPIASPVSGCLTLSSLISLRTQYEDGGLEGVRRGKCSTGGSSGALAIA